MPNPFEPVSHTINGIPETISRADYLGLIAGVGIDPHHVISLTFGPNSIDAVVPVLNEDGQRLLDPRLCEPDQGRWLAHTICIRVIDEPAKESDNV